MTKTKAKQIAEKLHRRHIAAEIQQMFHGGPSFDAYREYGFKNGWYHIGRHAFTFNVGDDPIQTAFDNL